MVVDDLRIRKATVEDGASIWDLRNAAIRAGCVGYYAADLLDAWTDGVPSSRFLESVPKRWLVAVHDHVVVATGILNSESGRVDGIFVLPKMMRRGIGRSMLAHIEALAVEQGLTKLTLDSTLNAAEFYRSCGYVGDAIGVYTSPRGFMLDCIPMEKYLLCDSVSSG